MFFTGGVADRSSNGDLNNKCGGGGGGGGSRDVTASHHTFIVEKYNLVTTRYTSTSFHFF